MKKFYIYGKEVSEQEALQQCESNKLYFSQLEQGNLEAGLNIKFIVAYDTENQKNVKYHKINLDI